MIHLIDEKRMTKTPVSPVETPKLSKAHQFLLKLMGGLITFIFWVSFFCSVTRSLFYVCFAWTCAPPRTFSVLEWKTPVSYFPEKGLIGGLGLGTDLSGEVEHASQTIFWNHGAGQVIYVISRFATFGDAQIRFSRTDAGLRHSEDMSTEFISGNANESRIRCGNPVYGGNVCYFKARYQEFVIYFRADIDREMTMDEFNAIVQYLDQQVGCDLYNIVEGNE